MFKWIAIGTVVQTAMVLVGHWVAGVANLFGPLGVIISLIVGLLWAKEAARGVGHGAGGGALVGGSCALIGIAVSCLLGDVSTLILLFGTLSSAVTGLIGGLFGARMRAPRAASQ
ncbi:MAG TPA: hypothetical protein VKA63_06310 [Candidatus Krumholzibacteria bacterium]|nr:hypothetical protein [Candidatus Krumholzibacteria bacterium]